VAISVVAAVLWMIENPALGVCVPDDLPHDFVLDVSKPYLGKFISVPSDWTPLQRAVNVFEGYAQPAIDPTDPWQFKNFVVRERD
jgi:homospermidine synthase